MNELAGGWDNALSSEFKKPYYKNLYLRVKDEYKNHPPVYPPVAKIMEAFNLTPLDKVKAVILGQDPYHEAGQAHGLAFSVQKGVDIPPSLVNIYKELNDDLGCFIPNNGYLKKWADEGVLLLNTVLTVRAHSPASHKGIGWEEFTDAVIRILNAQNRPVVYMLWGKNAAAKAEMLNNSHQLVLKAPHPSPLSAYRGFFGCKHFSRVNNFLMENKERPIDWQIEDI